jgi:hypothetical protein
MKIVNAITIVVVKASVNQKLDGGFYAAVLFMLKSSISYLMGLNVPATLFKVIVF